MELDIIKEQLKGAIGLGGRDRKAADIVERARSNIRNRIKDALNKIREGNPSLGQHLTNAIKTGISCSYIPDKPTRWSL
jgi:non-specific serine/threonine protein kinase